MLCREMYVCRGFGDPRPALGARQTVRQTVGHRAHAEWSHPILILGVLVRTDKLAPVCLLHNIANVWRACALAYQLELELKCGPNGSLSGWVLSKLNNRSTRMVSRNYTRTHTLYAKCSPSNYGPKQNAPFWCAHGGKMHCITRIISRRQICVAQTTNTREHTPSKKKNAHTHNNSHAEH